VLNPCGHCIGGNTGLDVSHGMDCAGTCNGNAVRDCTGVCLGTAKVDCAGVCTARINECLRCVGGSSGLDVCHSFLVSVSHLVIRSFIRSFIH
jgi:hypothetical protein